MGWFSARWEWAKANPLFWANLGLVAMTVGFIFLFPSPVTATGPSDFRLRTWGMVLQLFGVFTVWFDLTDTARKFGKGGFLRRTVEWLRAFLGRRVVVGATGIATASITGKARARVRWPIQPGAPLPDRVSTVEENLKKVDDDLDAAFREIELRAGELGDRIDTEHSERSRAIQDIRKSLEEAATGNLATLAFGAAWLALGVILATWAPEIVKVVGGHWDEVRGTL